MIEEWIEILVEEPSMALFLAQILPQILPEGYILGQNVFLRSHQGKSDLKKSIPKKLAVFSNWHTPAKVIIIHDQDSSDCKLLKQQLLDLCTYRNACPVLIRIACRELENWYLGDMVALESLYPKFKAHQHQDKAKYRQVDRVFGSEELEREIPGFIKGHAARNIAQHMTDLSANRSESFQQTISGIRRFLS